MALSRVKVVWSGFTGGPGVNILHFGVTPETHTDAANQILTATRLFYAGLTNYLPASVSLSIDPAIEVVEPTEGQIQTVYTGTTPAKIQGMATGNYSSASGAVVNWFTDDFVAGRRVRGRTFMVPLAAAAFDTNGTLSSGILTEMNTRAANFAADESAQLSIFTRPVNVGGISGRMGGQFRVTSGRMNDKAGILSSRRD